MASGGGNGEDVFEQRLEAEKRRLGLRLAQVRCLGTGVATAIGVLGATVGKDAGWVAALPCLAGWTAVALLVLWLISRRRRLLWVDAWLPAVLDVPMLTLTELVALPSAVQPTATSALMLGPYALMVMASALLFGKGPLIATTVAALASFGMLHLRSGGLWSDTLVGVTTLAMAAVLTWVFSRRMSRVVRVAADEQLVAWRLGRYFSPSVAAELVARGAEVPAPEAREVTVLFLDIRDFTATVETMDPRQTLALLNAHHAAMTRVLFEHGGTLDKFLGDGLLAYFGAPLPQEDHCERAVKAALAMFDALAALNAAQAPKGLPPLRIGVGVHLGKVVVGDVGSAERLEYTVIGDAVNFASRLEGLTKLLRAPIVCSDEVHRRVEASFEWTEHAPVAVKGRAQPVRTWTPSLKPGADARAGRSAGESR